MGCIPLQEAAHGPLSAPYLQVIGGWQTADMARRPFGSPLSLRSPGGPPRQRRSRPFTTLLRCEAWVPLLLGALAVHAHPGHATVGTLTLITSLKTCGSVQTAPLPF
jgi:hypothetical protein